MVHQGRNFFPISNVIPAATGYYMDVQGEVWSERARRGTLTKLTGSTTASGRYVTMQTNSRFGQSYRYDQLTQLCQNHPQWKVLGMSGASITVQVAKTDLATAMGLKPAVLPTVIKQQLATIAQEATSSRHHAPSVDAGIKARGWVIGTVFQGALTFGPKPAIHTTEDSVDGEIDRLAKLRPGQKFVKLQIQGAVTAGTVVWE